MSIITITKKYNEYFNTGIFKSISIDLDKELSVLDLEKSNSRPSKKEKVLVIVFV